MSRYDAVFIHAPSVYDFRKKPIFYGPVSDVIPSSPVFEMYPVGFMTISAHLIAAGFRTRIVNIANLMLSSEKFDVEKKIRGIDADVYFIDLHWLPHAHGAIELARIVKKYHPDSKVEFGGFSSSYFRQELILYPEVDLVMRGDTTEYPTVLMMETLKKGGDLSKVPNLIWKDSEGRVHENDVTWVLDDLDSIIFDYGVMIKSVMKTMDINGSLPWKAWSKVPLTSVFTVRGCSINCAECGGSHAANKTVVCRNRPAYRSPAKLAEDMEGIQNYMRAPIFIVGDIRQAGQKYCDDLLSEVRERGIDNHVVIELFRGASAEHFSNIDRSFPGGWSIEFSPDSYDESVRLALGKGYTNDAIDKTLSAAFQNGCSRFDLFFMTGLPKQTRDSALDTARAAGHLWGQVNPGDGLFIYDSPFAPFVDPGSRAFQEPEKWGYRLRARTLEDHRRLLDSPSWKHTLSYETEFMTRDDIGEVSYDAAIELTSAEMETGRITPEQAKARNERTETARHVMHLVDEAVAIEDPAERDRALWAVKDEGIRLMDSTITDKNDLDWRSGSIWSNSPRILAGLMKSFFRKA